MGTEPGIHGADYFTLREYHTFTYTHFMDFIWHAFPRWENLGFSIGEILR